MGWLNVGLRAGEEINSCTDTLLDVKVGSPEEEKMKIGFFGGLFASHPVGRELLLRFARHLVIGYTKKDRDIMQILKTFVIHIVPGIDSSFSPTYPPIFPEIDKFSQKVFSLVGDVFTQSHDDISEIENWSLVKLPGQLVWSDPVWLLVGLCEGRNLLAQDHCRHELLHVPQDAFVWGPDQDLVQIARVNCSGTASEVDFDKSLLQHIFEEFHFPLVTDIASQTQDQGNCPAISFPAQGNSQKKLSSSSRAKMQKERKGGMEGELTIDTNVVQIIEYKFELEICQNMVQHSTQSRSATTDPKGNSFILITAPRGSKGSILLKILRVNKNIKPLQPDTFIFINWLNEKQFVFLLGLRAGSLHVSLPFNGHYGDSALSSENYLTSDEQILRKFALNYATHHPTMGIGHPNCPLHPEDYFKDGVTNGGLWDSHEGSMMVGYVVDDNGRPIANASIEVEGSVHRVRSSSTGAYWRPLTNGNHIVTVSSPFHLTTTKLIQVIPGDKATQVIFKLVRDETILGMPRLVFIILSACMIYQCIDQFATMVYLPIISYTTDLILSKHEQCLIIKSVRQAASGAIVRPQPLLNSHDHSNVTWWSRGKVSDFCAGGRGSILVPGTDLSDLQTLPSPLTRHLVNVGNARTPPWFGFHVSGCLITSQQLSGTRPLSRRILTHGIR
uniref:Uncharacterized protein n=1 Tax=Timema douglasi TaxID=61478 RepID=A0A7R8VH81_TIMDO|nr:unnamed protein product [Timema douglasi]